MNTSSSALASNWGVGGKSHPSRRRLSSLSFVTARFQVSTNEFWYVWNVLKVSYFLQNNQESANLSEDSTSEGDRDSELGFRRSSRVSANHSVKSTFSLSTAVRSMWQQVIETDSTHLHFLVTPLRNRGLYPKKGCTLYRRRNLIPNFRLVSKFPSIFIKWKQTFCK